MTKSAHVALQISTLSVLSDSSGTPVSIGIATGKPYLRPPKSAGVGFGAMLSDLQAALRSDMAQVRLLVRRDPGA